MKEIIKKYGNLLDVLESAQLMLEGDDLRVFNRKLESKIYTLQNKLDAVFVSEEIEIVVKKKKPVKTIVESRFNGNVELIY